MILLAVLLSLGPTAPLADVAAFALACERQPRCHELAAIAWAETGYRRHSKSSKGACCYMGILGGRYDNPTCRELEADPDLCLSVAVRELEYWQRHCGKWYLDSYNMGWRGCLSRPPKNKDDKRCTVDCDSYTRKVRATQKRIEAATELLEGMEW